MKKVKLVLITLLTLSKLSFADSNSNFTLELGPVLGYKFEQNIDLLSTAQIGYIKTKKNKFFHLFWGALDDDAHSDRTQYLFGELGYSHKIKKTEFYIDISLGIGRVDQTSEYLSTHNMFTERISLGYKDYYISLRHLSNGGEKFGNAGPNKGQNTLTFGIKF